MSAKEKEKYRNIFTLFFAEWNISTFFYNENGECIWNFFGNNGQSHNSFFFFNGYSHKILSTVSHDFKP